MSDYFTDREFGLRARTSEVIAERLWDALLSLIQTRIDDGSFGKRFPLACPDPAANAIGTDPQAFARSLEGEVPDFEWSQRHGTLPQTPTILDVLEFCAASIGTPQRGAYHAYFQHYHVTWDAVAGRAGFVADVNRILARNAVAFELTSVGQARRLLPDYLGHDLVRANFRTGDTTTDGLLEDARSRFLAPKLEDRRDGLEKLWDAFERIKTLEPGADKRVSADAMLDKAARPQSELRQTLAAEAAALTRIGNRHLIRHSETDQEALETTAQVDFLFSRLFAFVHLVLRASQRAL